MGFRTELVTIDAVQAGEVVEDRFELQGIAGTGGMGTVWRARDRQTGELVAIKVLRAETSD